MAAEYEVYLQLIGNSKKYPKILKFINRYLLIKNQNIIYKN